MILFFFFFNNNEFNYSMIVKEAFRQVCIQKLISDNYCDMEEFILGRIKKQDIKVELLKTESPFVFLYKNAFPKLEDANSAWRAFEGEHGADIYRINSDFRESPNHAEELQLEYIESKAVVNWVYQTYRNAEERREATINVLGVMSEMFNLDRLSFADSIIYIKSEVDINIIPSFTRFCDMVKENEGKKRTFYYRGHSDAAYKLLPSIMRKKTWLAYERDMYNELIIACPSDFKACSSHLDRLVHMQHYGLPTRLLDVTRNPLVALYFACESKEDRSGEIIVFDVENQKIKYPGSDSVSVLASLPLFKENEKNEFYKWAMDPAVTKSVFNQKAINLLHEVKLEKPAFRNEIEKEDICNAFFVLSEKKNNRIIKQDGAFIICGLFEEKGNPIHQYRYKEGTKKQIYIIKSSVKKKIMKQLDRFTINKAFLFPEIEDVAEFIQKKYEA